MFVENIDNYNGSVNQIKALRFWNAKLKSFPNNHWRFARAYRNNYDGSPINMIDVAKYYCNLDHQKLALTNMEKEFAGSYQHLLNEFNQTWHEEPDVPFVSTILNVQFFDQTQSKTWQGDRMCFSASLWMACSYISKEFRNRFRDADEYLNYMNRYGDTTDPYAQISALNSLNYFKDVYLKDDSNLDDTYSLIARGIPVALGFLHRGQELNPDPTRSHYCCAIGFHDNGDLVVNDPYGSVYDNYSGPVSNGRGAVYKRSTMNSRFTIYDAHSDDRSGRLLVVIP